MSQNLSFMSTVTKRHFNIILQTVTWGVVLGCPVRILKHDQQDATLYNTLYYCQRSTFSSGFSAHHQELKSVHGGSGICQTWMSPNSSTLAVTAKKFDKHLMLHVQI
jgi:hypothetical protein